MAKIPRHCVFCGNTSVTLEHVWPKWIARYAAQWGTGRYTVAVQGQMRGQNRRAKTLDATVNKFCEGCNNTWMSDLEKGVEPILKEMMDPQMSLIRLDTRSRNALALWAYKTSLVAELMHGEPFLYPSAYAEFYRTRQPPPSAAVWTFACAANTNATSYYRYECVLEPLSVHEQMGSIPVTTRTKFCYSTFTVLRVAFQVFHHVDGDEIRYLPPDAFVPVLAQLWPNWEGILNWPKGTHSLDDKGLDGLIRSLKVHALKSSAPTA